MSQLRASTGLHHILQSVVYLRCCAMARCLEYFNMGNMQARASYLNLSPTTLLNTNSLWWHHRGPPPWECGWRSDTAV